MIFLEDILRVVFSMTLLTSPGTTEGKGKNVSLFLKDIFSADGTRGWDHARALWERHHADSKNDRNI